MTPELVISTGDPQGIGPEVSVAAARLFVQESPEARLVLVGAREVLAPHLGARAALPPGLSGSSRPLQGASPRAGDELAAPDAPGLHVLEVDLPQPLAAPPPSAAGGAAALAALEAAFARVRDGGDRALVTAPVSKQAVALSGVGFTGHTGWLAERCGADRTVMLFAAGDLRVALATVHLPLRAVPDAIDVPGLLATLHLLDAWLHRFLRLEAPRIAVLGLNPHAGEGGLLGKEEEEVLAPAVARFNDEGGRARGPFSADAFFASAERRACDAVLAMYHDQGLLPVKALAFGRAVNVTVGLPIVRTSVDHGCAFDIAGEGRADPGSMLEALRLAARLLAAAH